jgi:YtxH-like protein
MECSRYEAPSGHPQETTATTPGSAITWLLAGIGIGAGLGLLFAPSSGRELRSKIARGFNQTVGGINRGTQQLRQRGSNLLSFRRWRSG